MTAPTDQGSWDESPEPDERPNLLAVLSVLSGAVGIASLTLWCTGLPILTSGVFGALGAVLGYAGRAQAQRNGFGSAYASWGLILAGLNLLVSVLYGLFVGLSVL